MDTANLAVLYSGPRSIFYACVHTFWKAPRISGSINQGGALSDVFYDSFSSRCEGRRHEAMKEDGEKDRKRALYSTHRLLGRFSLPR